MKQALRSVRGNIPALLFFALILAFTFRRVLFTDLTLTGRDLYAYFLPNWNFSVESIKSGSLPFWNPYALCGTSILANLQSCVFYPLQIIFYISDVPRGMDLFLYTHFVMAGFFMFIWLKELKVGPWGSLFGGLGYAMSGFMFSSIVLTIVLISSIWCPLVFTLFHRVVTRKSMGWVLALSGSLGLMTLAGDPTVSYMTACFLVLFSVFKFFESGLRTGKLNTAVLLKTLLGLCIWILILFFQLLPFLEKGLASNHVDFSFNISTLWSVPLYELAGFVLPFATQMDHAILGYWEKQSFIYDHYAGVVLVIFALLALVLLRSERKVQLGFLLLLLATTICLGRNTYLYHVFHILPLADALRYPARYLFLIHFALATLAGIGLDAVIKRGGTLFTPKVLQGILFGSLSLAVVFFIFFNSEMAIDWFRKLWAWASDRFVSLNDGDYDGYFYMNVSALFQNTGRSLYFAFLTLLGVFVVVRKKVGGVYAGGLFTALLFLDLTYSTATLLDRPTHPISDLLKPSSVTQKISEEQGLYRSMTSPKLSYNCAVTTSEDVEYPDRYFVRVKDQICSNMNMLFGIPTFSGYYSLLDKTIDPFLQRVFNLEDPNYPILDFLNVKYIAAHTDLTDESPLGRFPLMAKGDYAALYQNEGVLPRATLAKRAVWMDDPNEILDKIFDKDFDPLETVYLLEDERALAGKQLNEASKKSTKPADDAPSGSAVIERYTGNAVDLHVSAEGHVWLVLSDSYEKNWRCTLDGRPTQIFRANFRFRAIAVPPGEHDVRFYYFPRMFYTGCAVSLITALSILLACLWVYRRRKVF